MASGIWHAARAQTKHIKQILYHGRKNREKKRAAAAIVLASTDPQQDLRIIGTSCRILLDDKIYYETEHEKNLMPWQGHEDNMIDRFDGRGLLEIIAEHVKEEEEEEEEEDNIDALNFEAYGALVEAVRGKVEESVQVEWVDMMLRDDPTAALPDPKSESAAGQGEYGSVGFDYGGVTGVVEKEEKAIEIDDSKVDAFALKFFKIGQYCKRVAEFDEEVSEIREMRDKKVERAKLLATTSKKEKEELKRAEKKEKDVAVACTASRKRSAERSRSPYRPRSPSLRRYRRYGSRSPGYRRSRYRSRSRSRSPYRSRSRSRHRYRSRSRSRDRYRSRSRSRSPRHRYRSRSRSPPPSRSYRSKSPPPKRPKPASPKPKQSKGPGLTDSALDRMIAKLSKKVGAESLPTNLVSMAPGVIQAGNAATTTIKKVGHYQPRGYGSDITRVKKR